MPYFSSTTIKPSSVIADGGVSPSHFLHMDAALTALYLTAPPVDSRPWHWTVATTGPGGQWIKKSTGPPKNPLAPQKHVVTQMFSRREFMISRVKLHTFVH